MFPRQTTIVAPAQNWPGSILSSFLENLHLYILQNGLTHVHSFLHLAIWVSRTGLKLNVWRRDKYNTTQNTVHSIYVQLWLVTYAPCISAHITSSIIHRDGEGNMGMDCDGLCECLHRCASSVYADYV